MHNRKLCNNAPETTNVVKFFKNREVLVAKAGKKGGTTDRGRSTPDEGHFCLVALRKLLQAGGAWVTDLRDPHILEYLLNNHSQYTISVNDLSKLQYLSKLSQ